MDYIHKQKWTWSARVGKITFRISFHMSDLNFKLPLLSNSRSLVRSGSILAETLIGGIIAHSLESPDRREQIIKVVLVLPVVELVARTADMVPAVVAVGFAALKPEKWFSRAERSTSMNALRYFLMDPTWLAVTDIVSDDPPLLL
jgi:hypothetical protein